MIELTAALVAYQSQRLTDLLKLNAKTHFTQRKRATKISLVSEKYQNFSAAHNDNLQKNLGDNLKALYENN